MLKYDCYYVKLCPEGRSAGVRVTMDRSEGQIGKAVKPPRFGPRRREAERATTPVRSLTAQSEGSRVSALTCSEPDSPARKGITLHRKARFCRERPRTKPNKNELQPRCAASRLEVFLAGRGPGRERLSGNEHDCRGGFQTRPQKDPPTGGTPHRSNFKERRREYGKALVQ